MSLRQTAPFPSGPAEIVKRPVEELSKEVSNIILNSPSPATQMARLDTKLDTILDKVNDSTKDLREELKATRDEHKATREEFKAEHEALSKKVDDLSQSRAADDDKAVLDAIGKDGAAYLLKHDGLDFDEDFKMTRTVERMVREALEKHNKIIGADEARDLVLKWVDRVNSEPKKPVSEGADSPNKAVSGNRHAARGEEHSGHEHGHHADYRKVPQPPKFTGSLNADVTCARTWFDSVMRYCDRVQIDPLEDFWGFLQGQAPQARRTLQDSLQHHHRCFRDEGAQQGLRHVQGPRALHQRQEAPGEAAAPER